MNNYLNRSFSINNNIKLKQSKIINFLFSSIIISPLSALFFKRDYYTIISYYSTVIRLIGFALLLILLIEAAKNLSNKQLLLRNLVRNVRLEFWAFSFMMIWTFFSCLMASDSQSAFIGTWRGEGYFTYIGYFSIFISSYLLLDTIQIKKLIKLLSFTSYLVAIIGFLSYNGLFEIDATTTQLSSVFVNSNHYGYYLAIAVILSVYHVLVNKKTAKIIHSIGLFILSFSLFLTESRGAWLGVLFSLSFFIIFYLTQKKCINSLLIAPIITIAISFILVQFIYGSLLARLFTIFYDANAIIANSEQKLSAGTKRWLLWDSALKIIKTKPLLGHGLDNTKSQLMALSITHTDRVHNEYLEYLINTGIIGTLAYILGLSKIIINYIKKITQFSLFSQAIFFATVAYLGSAFFGNTTPYVTPYLFIFLGILTKYNKEKQVKSNT